MKILHTYNDYLKANLDKSFLEESGIYSELFDEHTITTNWLYGQLLGGIKLVVNEADYNQAKDLLNHFHLQNSNHYEEIPPLNLEEEAFLSKENRICTNCGSRNTSTIGYDRPFAYLGYLFLGFPFIYKNQKHHCFHCGKQF